LTARRFRHRFGYTKPSGGIQWEKTPLQHATVARAWHRGAKPRLAGVDAFGIGGLNYHVIVEEPPTAERVKELLALPSEKLTSKNREPIAIVGVGCVLPEARGASEYWSLLRDGRIGLRDVPESRWSAEIYHQPGKSSRWRTYSKRGGFVTGFEPDWRRYKIPPKLVEGTDPLQFMLLESATEALEDAGVDLSKVDRQRVSTLVGSIFGSD
jgi:acyl transferase domain-containing protein